MCLLAPKMLRRVAAVFLLLAGASFGQEVPKKLISSSQQFVVYCDEAKVRGAVASFAEQVKTDVTSLLGLSTPWKYPVIVQIKPESSAQPDLPPSRLKVYETDLGLKVQVDVLLGADPAKVELRRQLVRAVLIEISLRENPEAAKGASIKEPPDWLIQGAIAWADSRLTGVDPQMFKILVGSARLPTLSEFLLQKDALADSTSKSLFNACSLALVKLLLELPEGRRGMVEFLKNLPSPNDDPAEMLGSHFQELAEDSKKREKWWALNLVRLAKAGDYSGMGYEDTKRKLDGLLELKIPTENGIRSFQIGDYQSYRKLKHSQEILLEVEGQLLELSARGSPLLRSIISEYHLIVGMLVREKTKGLQKRLEQVAFARRGAEERLQKIGDYMNWFEATQMQTLSGAFKTYLEHSRDSGKAAPKRGDPISRYLDLLEPEFE